jgi:transcriptional regulator GlxA family with amidase domain
MDPRVKRVIEIIDERFSDKMSADSMSKHVNLSSARLRHLFKIETGLSLMQYVKRLRMKKAATLLQTTFLSIKEVAAHTGSGEISHFVRDFKTYYSVTPSEFRARTQRSSPRPVQFRRRANQLTDQHCR